MSETNDLRNEQFQKICQSVTDNGLLKGFCYVQDFSMKNYHEPNSADVVAARAALENIELANDYFDSFLERQSPGVLIELHAKIAIPIMASINVFLCPDAEILLGFQIDKYSYGEVEYWWAISPIEPNGIFLGNDYLLEQYNLRSKFPNEYKISFTVDSSYSEKMYNNADKLSAGDVLIIKIYGKFGQYTPCVAFLNSEGELVGTFGRDNYSDAKIVKNNINNLIATVSKIVPRNGKRKKTELIVVLSIKE